MAEANGAITMVDVEYSDSVFSRALAVQGSRPDTFVHGDYKLNNLTVLQDQNGWRVSGIFDLHEARFGDGILDLVRQTCSYLDVDPPMADRFVQSYLLARIRIRQFMNNAGQMLSRMSASNTSCPCMW